MIVERTITYSLYNPYSIYFRRLVVRTAFSYTETDGGILCEATETCMATQRPKSAQNHPEIDRIWVISGIYIYIHTYLYLHS